MFAKLILAGHLGGDPEMRHTPTGRTVTNFSVATNRSYTNAEGEKIEETLWFRVSAWGKLAEVCQKYLTKGRPVLIEGRLIGNDQGQPRVWEDNDGKSRASFEIIAETVKFLGSGNGNGNAQESEEEIPF
jgi:single-strand DNA-binding protein